MFGLFLRPELLHGSYGGRVEVLGRRSKAPSSLRSSATPPRTRKGIAGEVQLSVQSLLFPSRP